MSFILKVKQSRYLYNSRLALRRFSSVLAFALIVILKALNYLLITLSSLTGSTLSSGRCLTFLFSSLPYVISSFF